jgi:hypothetical protein
MIQFCLFRILAHPDSVMWLKSRRDVLTMSSNRIRLPLSSLPYKAIYFRAPYYKQERVWDIVQ